MAAMVRIVRLGFRQIFRQAILKSIDTIPYLFLVFKEDSVNSLSGRT